MERVVIIGNSGSGKTTLARKVSDALGCARLDLDSVAWIEARAPTRESYENSCSAIDRFMDSHERWVIEGCYATLIAHAARRADSLYFLNIGIDACVRNCRSRPWEPGKYATQAAQDAFLPELIKWVRTYRDRDDEFSWEEHKSVFDSFLGNKREILEVSELRDLGFV